ncbi:MAG: hypothetical protein KC496_01335 [Anaerolineae bacterium]|nr:hypothetical protein [Anaerolineae bacterium]
MIKRPRQMCLLLLLVLGVATGVYAEDSALLATVNAGQTAEYAFEIRNDSAESHDYALSVEDLPADMQATFTQDGPVVDTVTIEAGGYQAITLRVDVPVGSTIGRFPAVIYANREDGQSLQIPITLNVENTYALRITSQNLNINTFSGQEFTLTVTASNTGAAGVTNVQVTADLPNKWLARMEPQVIDQLAPNESATFTVHILVSPAQIAIDQQIPLVINSDQTSSPEAMVFVRVQNSPDYLIYAVIVAVLAIGGAVIYFRLQGRR